MDKFLYPFNTAQDHDLAIGDTRFRDDEAGRSSDLFQTCFLLVIADGLERTQAGNTPVYGVENEFFIR
jgi:hypothetical protein